MRTVGVILMNFVLLAGCGEHAAQPEPTVETLAADPERLQETLKRCKADRAAVGDSICNAASQAFRQRFYGSGKPNYSPQPVDLFPQTPNQQAPKPITKSETLHAKQ